MLHYRARPAAEQPSGVLVLHHGRGTDENDLFALADLLDPDRALHVVSVRAPLQFQGAPGYHWYVARQVGSPDPDTFRSSYRELAALHDELSEQTGIEARRTVLAGFSQGTVMTYGLALGGDRPPPAGILAFSGFIPSVPGWEPSLEGRTGTRAFIAHGRADPVIVVDFGRRARQLLESGGLDVEYHESGVGHGIEPASGQEAARWLSEVLAAAAPG